MPFSIFGFRALWSPYYFLALVLVVVMYLLLTKKWRHWFDGTEAVTKKETIYFISSIVLLYIVKGSPLDLIGHILFSVHMTQMALLLLGVAPLMIMGIPNFMWRKVFSVKIIDNVVRLLTKPIISLLIFTIAFSMYHYPMILDYIKLSAVLHAVFTVTVFMAALVLWWPVVNTLDSHPQLHGLKKIGYVILSALLVTPACALIIFVDIPVYETYSSGEAWLKAMALCVPAGTLSGLSVSGPELFTNMPTVYDQQLGGIIMKIIQEVIYVGVIAKIFINWYRDEQLNADEITKNDLLERQKFEMNS